MFLKLASTTTTTTTTTFLLLATHCSFGFLQLGLLLQFAFQLSHGAIVLCGGFGDCSFVREAVHLHTLVHHCMGVRVVLGCHGYGARLRADLHKVFLKAKGFKSYALQACGLQRGLWKSYVLEVCPLAQEGLW